MCDSQNKATGPISFTLGALLGVGAGFFLSTKKGRKYVKEAWKKVEPFVDDVKEDLDEVGVKGRDAVEGVLANVKDFAGEIEDRVSASIKKPIKKTFFKGL